VRRIVAQISPNLPKKLLWDFCLQLFSHKDHEDLSFVWPPKNGLHVFSWKRWAPFLPRFSGILPGCSRIKTFGSALEPPVPPSYTTGGESEQARNHGLATGQLPPHQNFLGTTARYNHFALPKISAGCGAGSEQRQIKKLTALLCSKAPVL